MFTAPRKNQFSLNWNENNKGREMDYEGYQWLESAFLRMHFLVFCV